MLSFNGDVLHRIRRMKDVCAFLQYQKTLGQQLWQGKERPIGSYILTQKFELYQLMVLGLKMIDWRYSSFDRFKISTDNPFRSVLTGKNEKTFFVFAAVAKANHGYSHFSSQFEVLYSAPVPGLVSNIRLG